MKFLKKKHEVKDYSFKDWLFIHVETLICVYGADLYAGNALLLEREDNMFSFIYWFYGLVFIFFFITAFGNIITIYRYAERKASELTVSDIQNI